MADKVKCLLNIRDDDGTVVDTTEISIPEQDTSDIVDRAAELILAIRDGRDIGDAAAELDDALTAADVISARD